jgi:ketosteroid isomerase-like protein
MAALGELYTEDAALLPPGREIRGREAVMRYFAWGPNHR